MKILPNPIENLPQVYFIPLSLNNSVATNDKAITSATYQNTNQNEANCHRSLGCQTKPNEPINETQETACQTIYNDLIEVKFCTKKYCKKFVKKISLFLR